MHLARYLILSALVSLPVAAWEGVDAETGASVEIEKGHLVRPGETIEVYDYDKGEYRDVDVDSVRRFGNVIEVEAFDYEEGEYRTFEMED